MTYKVHITDTKTKVKKVIVFDMDFPEDDFWWVDGNYGCDCNRGLEIYSALLRR